MASPCPFEWAGGGASAVRYPGIRLDGKGERLGVDVWSSSGVVVPVKLYEGRMYRFARELPGESSSLSSSELKPSSSYAGPSRFEERMVPMPSVCHTTKPECRRVSLGLARVQRRHEHGIPWDYERTGGADTRLGRARLISSEYISSKSMSGAVFGGRTKPSLTWTFPVACVEFRVETRFVEMSCAESP